MLDSMRRASWTTFTAALACLLVLAPAAFAQGSPPIVNLTGGTAVEGQVLIFTATLSRTTDQAVTIGYITGEGTAATGLDFGGRTGSVTIPPGQTSAPIGIATNADFFFEPADETFRVELFEPQNARFGEYVAFGTIVNDLRSGRCQNIVRGAGRTDILTGSSAGDLISGRTDIDFLFGLGGPDCINGEKGGDIIDGGDGNDLVDGGDGADDVNGNGGNDLVRGGKGADVVRADADDDVAKDNADATFELVRKLLTVTSVADAVQLQTTFARERFEALVDYSKDLQTTWTKVGAEAAKPARALFDRTVSQAKAA